MPDALIELGRARTSQAADAAYWRIDNVVVLQGALYEAAVATAAVLLVMLPAAEPAARPRVLELLQQFSDGESHPSEINLGNLDLRRACLKELLRGYCLFEYWLGYGSEEEQLLCLDLIGACAAGDTALDARVRHTLHRCSESSTSTNVREHAKRWLAVL